MTTIEQHIPSEAVSHPRRQPRPAGARKGKTIPIVAVALYAALSGGVLGGAIAAGATDDAIAREAEREYARKLEYARQWDERFRQLYPFGR